jgi:SulP family sulfate permease
LIKHKFFGNKRTFISCYSLFGTSRTLAVGPVAVISLMTAAAASQVASVGTPEYITAAITLAFMTGLILLAMAVLRLGFLANFLSHPVISGFITASALLIAAGQLKVILGIQAQGHNFFELMLALTFQLPQAHALSAAIGLGTVAFLFWARRGVGCAAIVILYRWIAKVTLRIVINWPVFIAKLNAWH